MIWLLLAGLILVLLWYMFIWPLNHFTRMGIKQNKQWPILGDLWESAFRIKSLGDIITDLYRKFPNNRYMGIYQMTVPTLLVRDPELVKQIAVKDFDYFTDHRPFVSPEVDPLWAGNLFSLKGQQWREMRATLTGTFTSSKMKHMFGIINETAENFVKFFLNKKEDLVEVEIQDAFTRYTNDVIATAAFGIKVDSLAEPDNTFYNMGIKVSKFNEFGVTVKFVLFNVLPQLFKHLKLSFFPKETTNYFKNIIHETIHVREEKGIVRKDMINLLLEARKGIKNEEADVTETGFATAKESNILDKSKFKQLKQLSNDDITSQALIFFFAGFDTVSTALCFGSYELAVNKEVQDRLRKEIAETYEENNGKLTYDILLKMKYLDMVFTEILRKWPPVIFVDRVCNKPYTIEPITPDEVPVHLKVGDIVMFTAHGIQRDPEYYPEPEKFNPERFSDENKDSIKPYTFIPFGAGPRNCIGSRFAILESKALFYHLLLNFEIVPIKKTRIPLKLDPKSLQHTAEGGFWLGLKRIRKQ